MALQNTNLNALNFFELRIVTIVTNYNYSATHQVYSRHVTYDSRIN